jgi:hypothetical protein
MALGRRKSMRIDWSKELTMAAPDSVDSRGGKHLKCLQVPITIFFAQNHKLAVIVWFWPFYGHC